MNFIQNSQNTMNVNNNNNRFFVPNTNFEILGSEDQFMEKLHNEVLIMDGKAMPKNNFVPKTNFIPNPNFEILAPEIQMMQGLPNDVLMVNQKSVKFDKSPIQWDEEKNETFMMECIENKLRWMVQSEPMSKEQKTGLGFMSFKLLEKWIWSQLGLADKHSDRMRNWWIDGKREKVEFLCFEFTWDDMPQIIHNNWYVKYWQSKNEATGIVREYRGQIMRLHLTYNTHLKWLDARIKFFLQTKVDGKWVNV